MATTSRIKHCARQLRMVLLCIALYGNSACVTDQQHGKKSLSVVGAVPDNGLWGFFKTKHTPVKDCSDVIRWLTKNENRLTAVQERSGFTVEVQYRPAACIACMEHPEAEFTDIAFKKPFFLMRNSELYVLRVFQGKSVSDNISIDLTDTILTDLIEVVGNDTFPCTFLHLEALPRNSPYRSAVLGFDRPQDGQERVILLRDPEGRMGGDLKFVFPDNGLKNYWAVAADTLITTRS